VTSGEIRRVGALKTSSFAEAQDFVSTNPMVNENGPFELCATCLDDRQKHFAKKL